MKLPAVLFKILKNKYVLYFVAILSLVNVVSYLSVGNIQAVVLFIFIGVIATYFSKNMTLVLLVPLIIVNLFVGGKMIKEGMEGKKEEVKKEEKEEEKLTDPDIAKAQATMNNALKDKIQKKTEDVKPSEANTLGKPEQNRNNSTSGPRLDYAATMSEAYDNLNNILGGDGMQSLTQDTKQLVKQQQQLAEAMQGMTPLIENAQKMLQGLDLGDMKNMLGNLQGTK